MPAWGWGAGSRKSVPRPESAFRNSNNHFTEILPGSHLQGSELRLTASKKCVAHASFDRDGFRIRARETPELHVPRVSGTRGSTSKTHSTLTGARLLTWIRCPVTRPA